MIRARFLLVALAALLLPAAPVRGDAGDFSGVCVSQAGTKKGCAGRVNFVSGSTVTCSAGVCAVTASGAGSGTVTSITCSTGLTCTASNPVTDTGTIAISSGGVGATQLASGAVTTVKLAAANVTGPKMAAGSLRVLAANAGHNGAGTVTLTGAAVGDRVTGAFLAGGSGIVTGTPIADFESTITVINQIQQTSATDHSTDSIVFFLWSAS